MINKSSKNNRKSYKSVIFAIILLIYLSGIISCFLFAAKSDDNLTFIHQVIEIINLREIANTAVLIGLIRYMIRDFIYVTTILTFKYSGVLRGLVFSPIFIRAFLKTGSYMVLMHSGYSIFEMMIYYIIKDCAIAYLIVTYCFVITNEILNKKYIVKKDIKRLIFYCSGIILIYMIDCAVTIMI